MSFTVIETKDRLGDGHALLLAKEYVKDQTAFAVTMADLVPPLGLSLIKELVDVYQSRRVPTTSIFTVPKSDVSKYGVIDYIDSSKKEFYVKDIIEKPDPEKSPSNFALSGKYILTPVIFDYLETLMRSRAGDQEVKIADALKSLATASDLIGFLCDTPCFDTGNKVDFLKAEISFALKHPEIENKSVWDHIKKLKD